MIPDKFITADDFRYNKVPPKYLTECVHRFNENFNLFEDFLKRKFPGLSTEMRVNLPILYRIIERIDQKRDYYLYFHSNGEHAMFMSQAKETALFCYWLIKYKPISFEKSYVDSKFFLDNGCTANEYYAAFLLMSFIVGLNVENTKYFYEESIATLTYTLTNREISKEALIMYVESFLAKE